MVRAVHSGCCLWMGAGCVSVGVAADDGLERPEGCTLCSMAAVGGVHGAAAALHGVYQECYGKA